MVFPLLIPIALGGGVFASIYALQKLFNEERCIAEFDGTCNRECDYFTGDEESCYTCLGVCGVPPEDYTYYINMLVPYEREEPEYEERDYDRKRRREYDRPRHKPRPFYSGPPIDHDQDQDQDQDDRDDSDKYRIGRKNRKPAEKKKKKKEPDKPTLLQDRLDKLSQKHSREHIGGGAADMTQDTRGMYGIIIS